MVLLVAGILIGTGFVAFNQLRNSTDQVNTLTRTNETTRTAVTNTGVYLNYNYTTAKVICYSNFVVLEVYKATGVNATKLTAETNYTYDSTGKISSIGNSPLYNNQFWNVTYTYQIGDVACEGIQNTTIALKKVPDFLPVLVILFLAGVILVIVFRNIPGVVGGSSRTAEI